MEINKTYKKYLYKLCRICLNECDEVKSIDNTDNIFHTSVMELLRTFLLLEIDDHDALPNLICSYCEVETLQSCKFKQKCDKSNRYFKEYLKNIEGQCDSIKEETIDATLIPYNKLINYFETELGGNIEVIEEVVATSNETSKEKYEENDYNVLPSRTSRCKVCNKCFESKLLLMDHRRKFYHYSSNIVKCSICMLPVPTRNYKSHFLKHSTIFKCKYCEKMLSNNYNLQRHLRIHTHQTPYKCEFCSARFGRRDRLKQHRDVHMHEKPFMCVSCGLRFMTRDKFEFHQQNDCDLIYSNKYKRNYSCNNCFKTFAKKASLHTHELLHTDNYLTCNVCGKAYATEQILKRHILYVHNKKSEEQLFECDICAKKYSKKMLLKRHILNHFGLDKIFKCDICKKCFSQSGALSLHLKIHTGERPYICHICSKAFNKPFNLQRHIQSHENIRLFCCHICGKHFTVKRSLNAHLLAHSGDKPFICEKCGKTFVDNSYLKRHLNSHNFSK